MAFLSRVWLNPLRRQAQRLAANPQITHAAVLGALSRQPVDERVLWRLEQDSQHRMSLLVLTQSVPSWEHLVEQAGWTEAEEPQARVRPLDPLLARLTIGNEFAFRLRANTVSSTRHPVRPSPAQSARLQNTTARGVRVPQRTAQHQLDWLTTRVARWGFELHATRDGVPDVRLAARERVAFTKRSTNGSRSRVVLQTATFEGRLRITDPAAAHRSLVNGVGSGRAYGCGLITLAPLTVASVT